VTPVRLATADDAELIGQILADGFTDDPVMSWVFREDGIGTRAKLGAFFGFLAAEVYVPFGAALVSGGCAAVWTPPRPPDWPDERRDRFGAMLADITDASDRGRLTTFVTAVGEHHPKVDHWYLSAFATRPDERGQGLGDAVLAAALERVDGDGLPAYLESTNARNLSIYERHGFVATDTVDLPDGPPITTMWRDAR
jgi:GNAT superfamily N-acetyltransferase